MSAIPERLLSWLRLWGSSGATYWCPDEVWNELHRLGLVEGNNLTVTGYAALSTAKGGE